jgi:hypothetical protein
MELTGMTTPQLEEALWDARRRVFDATTPEEEERIGNEIRALRKAVAATPEERQRRETLRRNENDAFMRRWA